MTQPMKTHKRSGDGRWLACGKWLYWDMKFKPTWQGVTCGGCKAVQRAQKNPKIPVLVMHKSSSRGAWPIHVAGNNPQVAKDWRKVTCKTCHIIKRKAGRVKRARKSGKA